MKRHLKKSNTKSKVSWNREKGRTGRLYLEQAALVRTDQGSSKVIEIHLNMKQICIFFSYFFTYSSSLFLEP